MKLKHYKFPPQNYPPRISFKLMIRTGAVETDEAATSFDISLSTALLNSDADRTCMIDTVEGILESKK